jgi:deferrochelatase/peroxidase EfeB
MNGGTLQSGIYFQRDATPPPAYRLVLFNAIAGAGRAAVADTLERLLRMLLKLSEGQVRELRGLGPEQLAASAQQFQGLDTLIGYGRRFFDEHEHDPPLTEAERPDFLAYLPKEGPFPTLAWASARRIGEADFALQLTGLSEAAVSSAAVEAWKIVGEQEGPLVLVESFSGYGRRDGRGWLGFHDGVSNMASDERLAALAASDDPAWMAVGTYMAFLRIMVDLASWARLGREQQELLVGRDKLTGAALVAVRREGERLVGIAGRAPGKHATAAEQSEWRDPPQTTDPVLEASHIARANQSRASPMAPGALRIFRQGYDFLESLNSGGARLGLNFVSFQRDLRVLQQLLHQPGWLGDANFGGPTGEQLAPGLFTLEAGGLYAVPARAEPFPGANLLN